MTIRRSVLGCRETSGTPEKLHGALVPVERPRCESSLRIWEHTRCGCTQFDWVADVGWTHRASSSPKDRKVDWGTRTLARKKSVARLTRGADGQKANRCACVKLSKKIGSHTTCKFRLAGSQYDRRRSRAYARLAFTGRAKQQSSDSQVKFTSAYEAARSHVLMLDSTSGGHGFRLGCAYE
jgi:hypothetical protein